MTSERDPVGTKREAFNLGEEAIRKLAEVMKAVGEENKSRMVRRLIEAAHKKNVGTT